jgi:hypothetical protein
MFLNWASSTKVKKISCHKLVADKLVAIFKDPCCVRNREIKALQLDDFGGCFNYRKMRGGTQLSLLLGCCDRSRSDRNLLKETSKTARFASEYKQFIDIFYKHGFVSLGREKNYDWMHFQVKD